MSAATQPPEPHTEIDSIPARVTRLRQAFEAGRTRPDDNNIGIPRLS